MNKKLFVFIIKYMPIVQMIGILLCNILSILNHNGYISRIIDFFIGNNIITVFLLYICSYLFGFCKWHRLTITANLCSILFIMIKFIFDLQISNLSLILTIFNIDIMFILLILITQYKCKK